MNDTSIIFDLDGTLLDTLIDLALTGNNVLRQQGFPPHPIEHFRQFVGNGVATLVKRMMPSWADNAIIEKSVEMFRGEYQLNWQKNGCPYPGIGDMLRSLKEIGIPLAVLSNKPHAFTLQFCEKFFPEKPFSLIYGEREGYPRKPDPAVAKLILAELGARPSNSIFVGDSDIDMQTAKSAGMIAVGVSWGFRSELELLDNGADLVIHEPAKLVNYVNTHS
jgi:phosphoglycolate phosphatase